MRVGSAGPRAPGWWIPWLFAGFFALVLAVNGTMIWIALASWTGLAANQAYDRGLTYNRNLDAAARQAALGWRAELTVGTDAAGGALELVLTGPDERPVSEAQVTVRFERPTSEGLDFAVPLQAAAPGVYRGAFALPAPGVWDLHATILRGDDLHVHEQRVVLR